MKKSIRRTAVGLLIILGLLLFLQGCVITSCYPEISFGRVVFRCNGVF